MGQTQEYIQNISGQYVMSLFIFILFNDAASNSGYVDHTIERFIVNWNVQGRGRSLL
jgi:hypothetical protein